MEKLYSVKEAVEVLKLSAPTLWRNVKAGELQVIRVGSRVLFSEADLQAFVERKRLFTGRN